jgi:pimeloyl-ACP methyl ester carboxylesterase
VSLVCIDLPGHGHSDSAAAFDAAALPLQQNAADIATVIRALAPQAKAVVGMSLGGLTTLALARDHAELVRKLVLVDITPGVNQEKTKQITDFVNGPATFPSFEELLKRTIEFNPTRTVESLRRGILHNALQLDDGSWVWRYRRADAPPLPEMKAAVDEGDIDDGFQVFNDAETIDVNLLIGAPTLASTAGETQAANLIAIAENRKDLIAFVSPPISATAASTSQKADVIDFVDTLTSTSYAVVDSSALKIYDKYNDV